MIRVKRRSMKNCHVSEISQRWAIPSLDPHEYLWRSYLPLFLSFPPPLFSYSYANYVWNVWNFATRSSRLNCIGSAEIFCGDKNISRWVYCSVCAHSQWLRSFCESARETEGKHKQMPRAAYCIYHSSL